MPCGLDCDWPTLGTIAAADVRPAQKEAALHGRSSGQPRVTHTCDGDKKLEGQPLPDACLKQTKRRTMHMRSPSAQPRDDLKSTDVRTSSAGQLLQYPVWKHFGCAVCYNVHSCLDHAAAANSRSDGESYEAQSYLPNPAKLPSCAGFAQRTQQLTCPPILA